MSSTRNKNNADLKQLVDDLQKSGCIFAEPAYSDSSLGHYLVVFKTDQLMIKFSQDRSELMVWIKPATKTSYDWFRFRHIAKLLIEDGKIHKEALTHLATASKIAGTFLNQHNKIADYFSCNSNIEIAKRIRRIEESERVSFLNHLRQA